MTTPEPPPLAGWLVAVWAILALVVGGVLGPRFVEMFRPPPEDFYAFSQDWLSARNHFTGRPVYSPQFDAVKQHTGRVPPAPDHLPPWNSHPPASILLALPFGQITDYPTAHLYWNLATFPLFALGLLIVLRALEVRLRWSAVFPSVVLILLSVPVFANLAQGQLNFVLLPLLALAWWADRRDHQLLAGLALGLAAGLKLYPGFLFLYFLFAGRWRALAAGLVMAAAVNGAAAIIFDAEAYTTYVRQVLPSLTEDQSSWRNVALNGFWLRIYNPHPHEKIVAVKQLPQLAQGLALASQLLVAAITALVALRAKTPLTRDRAIAVGVIGMLVAAPMAWTHHFILLAIPVGVLWAYLRGWLRWAFWLLIVPLWLPENFFAALAIGNDQARHLIDRTHNPIAAATNLVALSAFTYVLLALFALALVLKEPVVEWIPDPTRVDPDSDIPVDDQRVDRRLFGHIGDD